MRASGAFASEGLHECVHASMRPHACVFMHVHVHIYLPGAAIEILLLDSELVPSLGLREHSRSRQTLTWRMTVTGSSEQFSTSASMASACAAKSAVCSARWASHASWRQNRSIVQLRWPALGYIPNSNAAIVTISSLLSLPMAAPLWHRSFAGPVGSPRSGPPARFAG